MKISQSLLVSKDGSKFDQSKRDVLTRAKCFDGKCSSNLNIWVSEVIKQLLFKTFFLKKTHSFMLFWPSEENFWPLTASITLEVKNDCVLVTMEGVLNKISRIKFSVGCRVWL